MPHAVRSTSSSSSSRSPAEPGSVNPTARPEPRRSTHPSSNSRSHSSAPRGTRQVRAAFGPVQTRERERPPPLARGVDFHADPPEQALALPGHLEPAVQSPQRATREQGVGDPHAEPPGQVVVARPPLPQPLGRRGGAERGHAPAGRDHRERLDRPSHFRPC